MGIFVGIGNYIGRVRQIGDGGGQPIGPNDYYIITEDEIAVLTERGKHILLDKYVTEDEIAAWVKEHMVFWYDFSDNSIWINSPQHGNIINNHTYNPMLKGSSSGLYTATGSVKVKFKATVTGMKSGYRLEFGSGDVAPSDKSIYEDGEYEFGSGDVAVPYGFKLYADDYSNPNTDVIIELKEVYPNALVTDGVDDYGQVQNLQQGVKMLFYTCNPFSLNKIFYDQTKQGWRKFNIYNQADKIAYNERNENGVTYIDGTINNSLLANNLLNVKHIITIVNNGADESNTISPIYFSVNQHNGYFANLAFYGSIGFDAAPEGNVTLQRVIDYVINNILNKA